MARKVGYGDKATGHTAPQPRSARRALFGSVLLCIMGGIGGAMALDGLRDGNILAFAVGTIWCVGLVSFGASKLIKNLLGLDGPRPNSTRHDWTLDDDGGE